MLSRYRKMLVVSFLFLSFVIFLCRFGGIRRLESIRRTRFREDSMVFFPSFDLFRDCNVPVCLRSQRLDFLLFSLCRSPAVALSPRTCPSHPLWPLSSARTPGDPKKQENTACHGWVARAVFVILLWCVVVLCLPTACFLFMNMT